MTWWTEKLTENRQLQPAPPLPPPQIAQQPRSEVDTSIDGLVDQAKASTRALPPAQSVAQRFGAEPGADVGTMSRTPGAARKPAEPTLLDLSPAERAALNRLAVQQGRYEGADTARAAQDQAALVQQLTQDGAFANTTDPTPRRAATTRGVAGHTQGNLGAR